MRRPLFGNGFPVQVNPDSELVVFDAAILPEGVTAFLTAYYYFAPDTIGGAAGVDAQVFSDDGAGTPQILLEDIDNTVMGVLGIIDKGAVLAIDRIPVTGTGRLIVKSEASSDQAFWVVGYFELNAPDTTLDEHVPQRNLQPSKTEISTATAIEVAVPAAVANPTIVTKVLHELTTEYTDELTVFVGVTKDVAAEPEDPIVVVI